MFYEEGNTPNMFVRTQGYTQWVLASNTECKHNFCPKKLHRVPF